MNVATSEFVSVGHPDKVADFISSYLLDRWIEKDPDVRYAVEVQVKDNLVTLGGEVTSKYKFGLTEIENIVREAVNMIGYSFDYIGYWGVENAMCGDLIQVVANITEQSADIAQGVNADGWGDQGIFWGMATNNEKMNYMPEDHYLASAIGRALYGRAKDEIGMFGLDIKTQVEVIDGVVTKVVVAVPMINEYPILIERIVDDIIDRSKLIDKYELIINGTGSYVKHSSMGDCGTTGRKLVVDFYGGNCRIGGGSPWTKDGTKADVALNLYARNLAVQKIKAAPDMGRVYVSISSCIGRKEIRVTVFDANMKVVDSYEEARPASEIINELGLKEPCFARKCMYGLFED